MCYDNKEIFNEKQSIFGSKRTKKVYLVNAFKVLNQIMLTYANCEQSLLFR